MLEVVTKYFLVERVAKVHLRYIEGVPLGPPTSPFTSRRFDRVDSATRQNLPNSSHFPSTLFLRYPSRISGVGPKQSVSEPCKARLYAARHNACDGTFRVVFTWQTQGAKYIGITMIRHKCFSYSERHTYSLLERSANLRIIECKDQTDLIDIPPAYSTRRYRSLVKSHSIGTRSRRTLPFCLSFMNH